uniref:Uncharacterized protein n=1 Tax=Salarias fasciatus TaxID=181472 RepID=A0A672J0K6_SALFA
KCCKFNCSSHLPFLNLPSVAPVFCFFLAEPLASGEILGFTFRLEDRDPVTVKNESSRPCVLPCLLFLVEPALRSHLNCFSAHMNWIRPSSSGSCHFSSTDPQSTTSGSRKRRRASLYSQSSGGGHSGLGLHIKSCQWRRGREALSPRCTALPSESAASCTRRCAAW